MHVAVARIAIGRKRYEPSATNTNVELAGIKRDNKQARSSNVSFKDLTMKVLNLGSFARWRQFEIGCTKTSILTGRFIRTNGNADV